MQYDVVALGELLIDFTGSGESPAGNPLFEANPGGAPGNVLAMLAKLGRKTAFIGKVGEDLFGRMLIQTVADAGIGAEGIVVDNAANTTLAFVHNAPDGDREFSFFRKPGADTLLAEADVNQELVTSCRIFHFGTLSLTHPPARGATQKAAGLARQAGALLSFDPNLRPLLWEDLEEAKKQMLWGCGQCDILKIAQEELVFLSGYGEIAQGVEWLRGQFPGIQVLLVTKGKDGAEGYWHTIQAAQPTFLQVKAVDTTGAGDTFCASCLSCLLEADLQTPNRQVLEEMLLFANAAASLVTAKKGAMRSMPGREEVTALVAQGPRKE